MAAIAVTFDLPEAISTGLKLGQYVRKGGVIQDTNGRIITWLRENTDFATVLTNTENLGELASQVNENLQGIASQIEGLQSLTSFASTSSLLSLGVSTLGFTTIYYKIQGLESRIKNIQASLEALGEKVDLIFYTNFRAALDLARNAFMMNNPANRRSSALQAIDRFLEAEHVYLELTDKELARQGLLNQEYILTLCLAFIAETRCYLELGEYATARQRLREGVQHVKSRVSQYLQLLLTDNPLIYLHPQLADQVDLARLTRIYQWLDPQETENSVFNKLRGNLVKSFEIKELSSKLPAAILKPELTPPKPAERTEETSDLFTKFTDGLPNLSGGLSGLKSTLISNVSSMTGGLLGSTETQDNSQTEIVFQRLLEAIETMETLIETTERFEAYEYEVKLLEKSQISLNRWLNASPKQSNALESQLIFLTPPKPLEL